MAKKPTPPSRPSAVIDALTDYSYREVATIARLMGWSEDAVATEIDLLVGRGEVSESPINVGKKQPVMGYRRAPEGANAPLFNDGNPAAAAADVDGTEKGGDHE